MKVPVHSANGQVVGDIELNGRVFGIVANEAVVHQALVRQLANARKGTANTKTRGEVAGGGAKLYRQKGLGRARAGSLRSPLRKGGGVIFGPHPRSYKQAMPKKMRNLAMRSVLSAKAASGELIIVDEFKFEQPKTKEMIRTLEAIGIDSSVLIVTDKPERNVIKSASNIPKVKTLPVSVLNIRDMLSHKRLVMTRAAAEKAEQLWAGKKEE